MSAQRWITMERNQSRCICIFPFILNVLLDFPSFEFAPLISPREDLPDDLSQRVITEAHSLGHWAFALRRSTLLEGKAKSSL